MKWTDESPTEPGWYWYRQKENVPEKYWRPHQVVAVDDCLFVSTTKHGNDREVKFFTGQWAGPIEEPEND